MADSWEDFGDFEQADDWAAIGSFESEPATAVAEPPPEAGELWPEEATVSTEPMARLELPESDADFAEREMQGGNVFTRTAGRVYDSTAGLAASIGSRVLGGALAPSGPKNPYFSGLANELDRQKVARAEARSRLSSGVAEDVVGGAVEGVSQAAGLAATGGVPTVIGGFVYDAATRAFAETGDKSYAATVGTLEGVVGAAANAMGLGGWQNVLKSGAWSGFKAIAKSVAGEVGQNEITTWGNALAAELEDIDPEALQKTGGWGGFAKRAAVALLGSAGVAGSHKVAAYLKNPSRSNAKAVGADEIAPSRAERVELAKAVEAVSQESQRLKDIGEELRNDPDYKELDLSDLPAEEAPATAEPAPDDTLTATKREFVDRDRERHNFPEIPDAESRPWPEVMETAKAEGLPERAIDIANSVLESPRPLSDVETAGLTIRMAELDNAYDDAMKRWEGVTDPRQLAVGQSEMNRIEAELESITRAARTSGTEKGRALASQKMAVDRNYNLASVITRGKLAKGTDLTPIERTKVKKLTDDYAIEQKRIAALEKKLGQAQADLDLVKAGEPIPKRTQRRFDVMSEQRAKLDYELQRTRQQIRDAINGMKPKSPWQRLTTLTDLSRGLITSTDYSAVGRQAKFAAWSHPVIAARNLPKMFKAGWSDRAAHKIEEEILSRPNAKNYELGMTIHKRDASLSEREEGIASRFLEKIPVVAGSQRAYAAFINLMRADVFDALDKIHGGEMGLSKAEYKQLGHMINVATGRGSFKAADPHMRSASLVLFAPRFFLSRIQYALGEPAWRSSNRIRKIVAQEYARTFLGAAVWYGLYAGAFTALEDDFSITFDPRSADFGKIKIGDTRIDPLAGLAQVTRFASRMLSGQTVKNGKAKDMKPYDKWQEVSRFARGKASPIISTALNVATGSDIMNAPTNLTSAEGALNLGYGIVLPLSIRDITRAMEDQGVPRGTALAIMNIFGEGVQVYDKKK